MDEMLVASALQRLRRKLLDLKADLVGIRLELAVRRSDREAKYNPNWSSQPRVPAGNSYGGQWAGGGGGGAGSAPHLPSPRAAGGSRHAAPSPQARVAGPKPLPPALPPQSFAEHVIGGAVQASAPLTAWSAERIRDAQARIKNWTDKNIPGGLDVAMQYSDFAARTLANLGGPEALRKYDELSDVMARGGDEAADAYHRELNTAVKRGTITRQQADDATVVVTTAVTTGMVLPIGRRLKRVVPKVEALHSLEEAASGIRKYKVGDNHITLTRNAAGNFDSEFTVRTDYGDLQRSREVVASQRAARQAGKPGDVGFHTLPHRFYPGVPEPIVPGDRVLNSEGWRSMENDIARSAKAGHTVSGSVKLQPSNERRPNEFIVEYKVEKAEGDIHVTRRFENGGGSK